ncbi:hypothetical protein [Ruminococcus sp.]|uniref:hypothetical protein n=1 Tax=Ruminococcus sp. TaxID=41978 RepID=UPI0025CCDCB3|nr:hypothetical protein [Ruminococcus sp.]
MAIEHTTFIYKTYLLSSSRDSFVAYLNAVLSAYAWEEASAVTTGNNLYECYGKYYFTADSYVKISCEVGGSNFYVSLDIITPTNAKRNLTSGSRVNNILALSVGKTSKGVCLCVYSNSDTNVKNRDPHFYNLYVGDITKLDGSTAKGCVYVADDNSYMVATDDGISSEATFTSTIDAAKKGYLIPVTDSTTGAVFKDVYMMACAPVQYNKMKIADTGTKYLCGKAMCIAD